MPCTKEDKRYITRAFYKKQIFQSLFFSIQEYSSIFMELYKDDYMRMHIYFLICVIKLKILKLIEIKCLTYRLTFRIINIIYVITGMLAFPLTKDKKMKLLLLILFQFRENDEMEHDNAFSVPTISFKRRVYFNLIISLLFSFALYIMNI